MTNPCPPLDFLLQQSDVKEISAPIGTVICRSGDTCQDLIIIQEGVVRVYYPATNGRRITLYHIGSQESCILTASCIINGASFPAIAEAESVVKGYAIPAIKVREWMQSEPQWQQYLFSLLAQRMASLIELVNSLAFKRLDNRLAEWLLQQSYLNNNTPIQITHQLISEELASSREVISRLLKEFEREQLIQLARGSIQLLDLTSLQSIAHEHSG